MKILVSNIGLIDLGDWHLFNSVVLQLPVNIDVDIISHNIVDVFGFIKHNTVDVFGFIKLKTIKSVK